MDGKTVKGVYMNKELFKKESVMVAFGGFASEDSSISYKKWKALLSKPLIFELERWMRNPDFKNSTFHDYKENTIVTVPFSYADQFYELVIPACDLTAWATERDGKSYSVCLAQFIKDGPTYLEFNSDKINATMWFDCMEGAGKFIADNLPYDVYDSLIEYWDSSCNEDEEDEEF